MPESIAIGQFARRLSELGCPVGRVRLCAQELADHHQDLKDAAREEGMSEAAADARADELLGEPVALAEHLAAVLRNSSWWGRHPLIGFCLLPPVALIVVVLLVLAGEALLGTLYFSTGELRTLTDTGPGLELARTALAGTYYAALALTALIFCGLARRSSSGLKWALAACAMCSLHGYFLKLGVAPRTFTVGYYFSSQVQELIGPAIPLAVAAAALAWHWQNKRRFAPAMPGAAPAADPGVPSQVRPVHFHSPKTGFLTPSSVIAAFCLAAIAGLIVAGVRSYRRSQAHRAQLRANVWPAERAAVLARVQGGQIPPTAFHGTTVDLRRHVNLRLRESVNGPDQANGNSLVGLPAGVHTFGGVPFDVAGRIQLMGRRLTGTAREFPASVRNIRIGRKAERIHLLHGACFLDDKLRGTKAASLLLHYTDGSQSEFAIIAGDEVLDWWGPIYRTGVAEAARDPASPGTELAWVGSNPRIKQQQPDSSLRLYRSTFKNPRPDLEIVAIDYVSALTDAAPFLVGLTVE